MCAEIDERLAPVVGALWRAGFKTLTSCQDAGESSADWADLLPHMAVCVESRRGWGFIDFPVGSGMVFLTAIAKAGPRDAFYVRMTHWAAPDLGRLGQAVRRRHAGGDPRVAVQSAADARGLAAWGGEPRRASVDRLIAWSATEPRTAAGQSERKHLLGS
jgi:hypothetical protein